MPLWSGSKNYWKKNSLNFIIAFLNNNAYSNGLAVDF